MQTRQIINIIDIDERVIPNSGGKKEKYVRSGISILGDIDNVGIQTYYSANASNIILSYRVKIKQQFYNKEKYIFFNNNVYEVKNIGNTDDINNKWLFLSDFKESKDAPIKNAIMRWINERI